MKYIPLTAGRTSVIVSEIILKLKVRDVMQKELITATEDISLKTIQGIMKKSGITGLPIVTGNTIIGIISMDDIINALDNRYIDELAGQHMSVEPVTLEDDMPLTIAISYFDKYKFGRFPVLNKNNELVGMVSQGDILSRLLYEITLEVKALEDKYEKPHEIEMGSSSKTYVLKSHDFENAGKASSEIKKYMKKRGINSQLLRRIAVASYELEINVVVHSMGGTLIFNTEKEYIEIIAKDNGPGIEDIDTALKDGFTTATDKIRAHGFGAGMGLTNVQRVTDKFEIKSSSEGTIAHAIININFGS
jgi:CBS domain-containing protein/anti-sigma regulatory factor (Ser/Thr protein kinase)